LAAVNKNFVVKNGIEVATNLIYGDATTGRVGIGTTIPAYALDVRGGIGATSVSVGQTITANSGIFTSFNVSGVATVTTLNATGVTATAVSSTWSQVGLGLTFTTGISTNFTVSGVGTITTLNATGVAATAVSSTWSQVGLGLTFRTGIGTFINITGVATAANLYVSGIASVGTAITMYGSTGIISASKYYGDGSGLTGVISGVGINTNGVNAGYAATIIDFRGPGISTAIVSNGIATVFVTGGGGSSSGITSTTINKQSFNVGVAGTNLLTLVQPYTSGNIDIYLNGLKLSPGDFSEASSTTIGLTTSAVLGDTIDTVSFATIINSSNVVAIQSGGVSVGGSITTLNFIGYANTFRDRGNGIIDVSIGSTASFATTAFNLTGTASTASFATTAFNLTGTASTASFATTSFSLSGTPNITVGTIAATSLNASGVVTATSFSGSGANLTGISSVSFATTSFGLSGTPNLNVGVATVTQLGINTTTIPTKLYVQGNAASNIVTLTDGATITPDFTLGNNFQVTIAASRTIANPTGVTTGQSGVIFIQEDGTGGYTVGWGTSWDFASSTAPTLITTASALNALPYFARSTTSIVVGSVISGIGTL